MQSEKNSPNSGVSLKRLTIVVFLLIALCAMSCKSPTRVVKSTVLDSLQSVRQSVLTFLPVPASEARMTLPMSQLAVLPEGAGYSARSGQVRGHGDTLTFTSSCDSLAREVIALREEITRIRNETGEEVEEPPPQVVHEPTGWQWFQIWAGRLLLIALSLIIVYRLFKQRLNKS